MAKGYQVVVFKLIDFDANWDRLVMVYDFANVRYTALGRGGTLAVVVEAPGGTLTTYRYFLSKGEEVFVMDQVIHIPARCRAQERGNTIKCG